MRTKTSTGRGIWVQLISKQAFRQYLKFRDMTITELAHRAGCSVAAIGHLHSLNSPRNTVGPELAKRICKALDCPTSALFIAKTPAPTQ